MNPLFRFSLPALAAVALLGCAQPMQEPRLLFGGEMHNSNASTPESIDASLDLTVALGYNAVLAPVCWEQLEPEQGRFDFTLTDYLVRAAGKRGLRLGLLWFGSWKNGESSYPPLWVKGDTKTYFRAESEDGAPMTTISPFCAAACEADSRAFAELMRHLRETDKRKVVCTVQVENECGVFLPRDCCPAARKAWEEGKWAERPSENGTPAEQVFMAEACARFVDAVAAAGKAEYDLPLFTNAWLMPEDAAYGSYPNGGPREAVLDVWKRCAPHLDWLSPDIYASDFAAMCAAYGEGQPLFIPETSREPGRYYYAFGEAGAQGVFCFGYEEDHDNPYFVQECRTLGEVVPLLEQDRPVHGFFRQSGKDALDAEFRLDFGDCVFRVHCIEGEQYAHGLAVRTGEDEFLVAGLGAWIDWERPDGRQCKLAWCEEIRDGAVWQVLNGDETGHGNMLYLRGRLWQQDETAPDGTPVPAARYGLSHQRRFLALAHNRFKTTGIYRIRLYSYPAHED
ncbi:MAG: DUF5597 domain-containing protein [Bacteroidales bacterium]|nr:DUF5597 domain-containing protein [Bacteroidales bacterium]